MVDATERDLGVLRRALERHGRQRLREPSEDLSLVALDVDLAEDRTPGRAIIASSVSTRRLIVCPTDELRTRPEVRTPFVYSVAMLESTS